MKRIILALLTITNIMSYAQSLPKHIDLQELGLSFDIPDGWTGQFSGDYILLGHQSIPGLMVLFANTSPDAQTLKRLAMQGIVEGATQLQPVSEFTIKNDNKVEGMYEGRFDGTRAKAYAIGLINRLGSGMNIVMVTEPDKFSEAHKAEANKLASSVAFYQANDSEATIYWKNKLAGRQLKYMDTQTRADYTGGSTNLSEKTTFDLCSDGSFYFYSSSQSNVIGGNLNPLNRPYEAGSVFTSGNNEGQGVYKIYSYGNESIIEFHFESGKVVEYDLSEDSQGSTYLDERRYMVLAGEACR